MTTLAVTGATGHVGGRVARLLSAAGVPQRLLVRDPARAPVLDGATVVQAEYGDATPETMTGVDTLFMVSASESADRVEHHLAFVDAAVAAGVGRIVYLSFYGAAPDATFTLARDHWATEEHIRATGLPHTFLRDNMYADFLPYLVGEDGVIRGPAADGKTAAVAQDDIAEVVVTVLREPGPHDGATYSLTGPEALTLHEIAAFLVSQHLGWISKAAFVGPEVRYEPETVEEAYASRAKYNAPQWQVDAWVSTYTAIAAGELAGVTDDVRRITGHPPLTLAEVLARR
jgi:NAD(P)H dehydrogenase (quinone)